MRSQGVTDDGDGVGFEVAEFPDSHPGSGQQLDRDSAVEVWFDGEGAHEADIGGVVEELGEGLVAFGDVTNLDND